MIVNYLETINYNMKYIDLCNIILLNCVQIIKVMNYGIIIDYYQKNLKLMMY